MRLTDCSLNVDRTVAHPVEHSAPEEPWVRLRDKGILPESVYRFYCDADYFSFSKAPPFLADEHHVLFAVLENLTEAVRDHLASSARQVNTIKEMREKMYTPLRRALGQEWDPEATEKEEDALRLLLLNLASCLDVIAEIASLFLPGMIDGLRLGRASARELQKFLDSDLGEMEGLVGPEQHLMELLHRSLRPLFQGVDEEKDWFALFILYRNKLAHIGSSGLLHKFRLHDADGKFYTFLPNRWPFLHKSHLTAGDEKDVEPMPDFLKSNLIHQDVAEYSARLYLKIWDIVEKAFGVFREIYANMRDLPLREEALDDLRRNSRVYGFRAFR